MKVRRYDYRVRRTGRWPPPGGSNSHFEEGTTYITGRVASYTKIGTAVTVNIGRRMLLREKRASAWRRKIV